MFLFIFTSLYFSLLRRRWTRTRCINNKVDHNHPPFPSLLLISWPTQTHPRIAPLPVHPRLPVDCYLMPLFAAEATYYHLEHDTAATKPLSIIALRPLSYIGLEFWAATRQYRRINGSPLHFDCEVNTHQTATPDGGAHLSIV